MFYCYARDLIVPITPQILKIILSISLLLSCFECFLFFRYKRSKEDKNTGIYIFVCSLLTIGLMYISLYAQIKMDVRSYNDIALLLAEKNKVLEVMHSIDLPLFNSLKIVNLPSIDERQLFRKELILKAEINNLDDFYAFANNHFELNKQYLEQQWKIGSPELLKTLFFMNLVSSMWGYGNVHAIDKPGCVLINENTNNELISEELRADIMTYIKTDIGCCRDSAYVLNLLLTKAGIKNRFMANPGHIFNEAYIDGAWMAFDATTNIWWHSSWEEIQNSRMETPFYVTLFPHGNLVATNPYYRDAIGRLRLHLLLQAVYKISKHIEYPELV